MREATARRCEYQRLHRSQQASAQFVIAGQQITIAQHDAMMTKRLVYICDWLPPDFGAVGQYAVLFARQWASEGWAVTLVGLTSGPSQPTGRGASGRWLA